MQSAGDHLHRSFVLSPERWFSNLGTKVNDKKCELGDSGTRRGVLLRWWGKQRLPCGEVVVCAPRSIVSGSGESGCLESFRF